MFEKMAKNGEYGDFFVSKITEVHKFCKNESFSEKGL
jgi:hypothetical protein